MGFVTKKESIYMIIITIIFILIIVVLVLTLPLKKELPKDKNKLSKDINNFNPVFDGNTSDKLTEKISIEEKAKDLCISLCKENKGVIDYSNGPCLSDIFGFKLEDWVCDIAHDPRTQEDNDQKNQCKAFINRKAHHFIEVDENCNVIRLY